jgi:GT2 family glycosyltransferase
MNKGALRAKGDWLLFLQGDDWLPEGTIKAYRQTVRANPGCEIVCGSAEALREASNGQQVVWKVWRNHDKKLTVNNIALGEPMINARLIRRNAFERLGGFSKEYALASDRDFLIRAANMGIHQVEIEEMTYTYRWHSGSSTMTDECRLSNKLLFENLQIAKRHSQNMSGTAAKAILKWHSKLAVQGALTCLEKGEGEFIGFVTAGIKQDRMWPWIFLIEILACFPGFLMRGCRPRTSAKL